MNTTNEKSNEPEIIQKIRDVLTNGCAKIKCPITKRKLLMDSFTASGLIQLYDALNPPAKAKMASLSLLRMVDIMWKITRK